jgi:hypothetical protein
MKSKCIGEINNMIVNIILYIYFFICMLILLYTIGYIFYNSYQIKLAENKIIDYQEKIKKEIHSIKDGKELDKKYIKRIKQKLKKPSELVCFQKSLENLEKENESTQIYIKELEDVIEYLAWSYSKKENMQKAYFAHFFTQFNYGLWTKENFLYIFISYLDNSSIYVRENVLHAMYASGKEQWIIKIFQLLSDEQWFHHFKLIGDGLMEYPGDKGQLAQSLWRSHDKFSNNIQYGVVMFITQVSDQFKEIFLEEMQKPKTDFELRLSYIRYFRKYWYAPAESVLCHFLLDQTAEVELRIVSARTLGAYESSQTIYALKNALSDTNWYVRFNASESLVDLKASSEDLKEVFDGEDKYAKEIIQYKMKKRVRVSA